MSKDHDICCFCGGPDSDSLITVVEKTTGTDKDVLVHSACLGDSECPPLVLSIRQPWAWLIANDLKNIENRSWPTKVRGRFLIHASSKMTVADWNAAVIYIAGFSWGLDVLEKMPKREKFQLGGIVGEATILACVNHHSSEWFTGPYGFVLANAKPLHFRPMKGRLGFFRSRAA
jgi:hypothetical protein